MEKATFAHTDIPIEGKNVGKSDIILGIRNGRPVRNALHVAACSKEQDGKRLRASAVGILSISKSAQNFQVLLQLWALVGWGLLKSALESSQSELHPLS